MKLDKKKKGDAYIVTGFTDMRKQINGLARIVQDLDIKGPFTGNYYLFLGKTRPMARDQVLMILKGIDVWKRHKKLNYTCVAWKYGAHVLIVCYNDSVMSNVLEAVPDDVAGLKSKVLELQAQVKKLTQDYNDLRNEYLWTREQYASLVARYFGASSERNAVDPAQKVLEFNEAEGHSTPKPIGPDTVTIVAEHERKKRGEEAPT